MALIEEIVYARTTGFAALAAEIATRCYPDVLPQASDLSQLPGGRLYPAIRYLIVSNADVARTHDLGPNTAQRPRVQFDVYAETKLQAAEIGELVRQCWDGFKGEVLGQRVVALKVNDLGVREEEIDLYRRQFDFMIWHTGNITS